MSGSLGNYPAGSPMAQMLDANPQAFTANGVSFGAIGDLPTTTTQLATQPAAAGGPGSISPALGVWAQQLQPASWNGVAFKVKTSILRRGRRTVLHEYPYRDTVWVEDLGRGTRTLSFSGFLIGDNVYQQRAAMLLAVEKAGAGQLVHPSLGSITVSLSEFSAVERFDLGRVVELEFAFIDAGLNQPQNPATIVSTQAAAQTAAAQTQAASGADFGTSIAANLLAGVDAVQAGVRAVTGFANLAVQLVNDGTRVLSAVKGMAGIVGGGAYYGRFNLGNLSALPVAVAPLNQSLSIVVNTEAATTAVLAASVGLATGVVNAAAALVNATTLQSGGADASVTLTEALRAACNDPGDAVRLLTALAQYTPTIQSGTAPIDLVMAAVQTETGAMCRRAALASLVLAAADYQPSSYSDAIAVMVGIITLIDAESLLAADADDSQSYIALRQMRAAVAIDLTTRGSQLPLVVTVTRPLSLPALFLAYQLYQDTTRTWDLIGRANPIHPAFMPTSFQALAA